jgi:UDP-N-acetylmuramate-alanine ligase
MLGCAAETGIAIAGAHGKTTTTSMVAMVLERGGLDHTAVIGDRLSVRRQRAARRRRSRWPRPMRTVRS